LWLEEVRGVRCGVITGPGKRPVPLRSAVLLPDLRLLPLLNDAGKLNPEVAQMIEREKDDRERSRHGRRGREFFR
jgi:hypothetical protein